MQSDDDILLAAADGGPDAFAACVDRFGGLVWSLALRMMRDRTDAEDAVQEVFAELWRSAHRFDPAGGNARSFVAAIARRRLIDRIRVRERHRRDGAPLVDEPTSLRHDPSRRALIDDEACAAIEALSSLRPEQQEVIRLALHESWTHERIAEHLGAPVGTVKTHMRRGLLRLRDLLAGDAVATASRPKPDTSARRSGRSEGGAS